MQLILCSKHSTNQLLLYREISAAFSEIHTKHTNTVCGQNLEFFLTLNLVVHTVTTGLQGVNIIHIVSSVSCERPV